MNKLENIFNNIAQFIEGTTEVVIDYVVGNAFRFWVWLGEKLEVEYTVPGLNTLIAERDLYWDLYLEYFEKANRVAQGRPVVVGGQPTGSNRPNRKKLSESEVETIRGMARSGYSQREIADTYDVNPATISRIVRGQYHGKGVAA